MPFRPRYTGLIDKYRDRLPVHDDTRVISLGEGNTPLIRLNNIPRETGKEVDIYVKYEGLNPTGSFKDRGMTMAVTKAAEEGSRAVICASTGNTSASAAAYAARAGITAFVLIPEGKIALGKLAQAMIHGAVVLQIRGTSMPACNWSSRWPSMHRSLSSTPSTPTVCRDRRQPPAKLSRNSGGRRTTTVCLSVMPAISPRTGSDIASIPRLPGIMLPRLAPSVRGVACTPAVPLSVIGRR